MKINEEPDPFEELQSKLGKHAAILGEHCDSIIIIATLQYGQQCKAMSAHSGNSFAIDGSIDAIAEYRIQAQGRRIEKQIDAMEGQEEFGDEK